MLHAISAREANAFRARGANAATTYVSVRVRLYRAQLGQAASSSTSDGTGAGEAAGGGDIGEGGDRPARRVRGDVGVGGAAAGAERADQDGAVRPEEGRAQGRGGALGAHRRRRRRRGVPRRPARHAPLLRQPLRRRRQRRRPEPQQGRRVDLVPPRQGLRVRGVREQRGGAAGVLRGSHRRGAAAVEQALQHLHALLRAGRLRHGLRHRRRRRHGRPLRLLRA